MPNSVLVTPAPRVLGSLPEGGASLGSQLAAALVNVLAVPIVNRGLVGAFKRHVLLPLASAMLKSISSTLRSEVSYMIGKSCLLLPATHPLPAFVARFPTYGRNIGPIALAVSKAHPGAGIIDVGANVGDTVAFIRDAGVHEPILCIEPAKQYRDLLLKNIEHLGDVTVDDSLLDRTKETRTGDLTIRDGSASLQRGKCSVSVETLNDTMREHPRYVNSKLLKIDTDGFDGRIIEGSIDWLVRSRPVIFWECDLRLDSAAGGPGPTIFPLLEGLGYRYLLFYMNTGEYLLGTTLDNEPLLRDLVSYFTRKSDGYVDVCAIHGDDAGIWSELRRTLVTFNG